MKISDLKEKDITIGMRIWNFNKTQNGTITNIIMPPKARFQLAIITWDDGTSSSFFENQCDCEVRIEENNLPMKRFFRWLYEKMFKDNK